MKDIEWIDSDCAEFQKYGFSSAFMKSLKEFYTAKKNFSLCPNEDTRYEMKFLFQHVHSALKSECAKLKDKTVGLCLPFLKYLSKKGTGVMQLYCEYCGKELDKEWLLIGAEFIRKDGDYGEERFCSVQCLLDSLNVLKESFSANGGTEIKGYYQLNQKECSEKEGN